MLNQDTFYWGSLKGVGQVYVQAIVDVFCLLVLVKVLTAKLPITVADLHYRRVLPIYEALDVKIGAILTGQPAQVQRHTGTTPVRPSGD